MTLILKKPTGAQFRMRQAWQPPMDPDAAAYITAVETADGQALEEQVKIAIDNFVLGCKADGIWNAIKASCILAGARTLNGALVPLAGTAPANVGPFVAGDYNRKTGLIGDASSKRLETGYITPQANINNAHHSIFVSAEASGAVSRGYIGNTTSGTGNAIYRSSSPSLIIGVNSTAPITTVTSVLGFFGGSRTDASSFNIRRASSTSAVSSATTPPSSLTFSVFSLANGAFFGNQRLAFYSIGEALDLARLDGRVTDLITAISRAF